jgi:hypothetical protein
MQTCGRATDGINLRTDAEPGFEWEAAAALPLCLQAQHG